MSTASETADLTMVPVGRDYPEIRDGVRAICAKYPDKYWRELEDKDALKRRVEEASRYVALEQLCLSPQCGFSSTVEGNLVTQEQQVAKLRLIVETAEEIWG